MNGAFKNCFCSTFFKMDLLKTYNYYYYDLADPRVMEYAFMRNLWPIVLLLVSYLYLVLQFGPRYMKNRPAYDLKTFIKLYNLIHILGNAYIASEILAAYPGIMALKCNPPEYSRNPAALRAIRVCCYGVFLKISDLIETGVFLLRKKDNQVTFLHLYHHISTLLFVFILTRYICSGMSLTFAVLNCLVHVIMYTYYFLSNFDGSVRKVVHPLKRYITLIQMTQFVFMAIQTIIALLPSCRVPKLPPMLFLPNICLNFYLFYNFYRKTYIEPKKKDA